MAITLSETESGLTPGTMLVVKRALALQVDSLGQKVYLSHSAKTFRFDRAGHNHYDGLYVYCFTFPSGEELLLEFTEDLSLEERIKILREYFSW